MSDKTVPVKRVGIPTRRIVVTVQSGPQAGKVINTEADVLTVGSASSCDLILEDRTVSRYHLELSRRNQAIVARDLGSTNGTALGAARLRGVECELTGKARLKVGATELEVSDGEVVMLESGPSELFSLKARAPNMRRLLGTVEKAAASDVSVLVLGESGTGKELIGRALHEGSPRKEQPFVTVDCGSLSPTLFASELFGHERGAFTGADRQRIGAFERADGGTVFLDEIGELSSELQSALLGVLERRTLKRLGGDRDIAVNVRVLSATSRDLLQGVNQGTFRLDLFYRLSTVRLEVPPLRERPEDIAPLVEHFLAEEGQAKAATDLFDADTMSRMKKHQWPGNVRELRNVVLGTLALGAAPELPNTSENKAGAGDDGALLPYRDAKRDIVTNFELNYLKRLLASTKGNVREAARKAQMNRSYLIELLTKHGLR